MSDLNVVTVIGRMTKEIDIRSTASGKSVGSMSIAVNDGYKDKNGQWVNESSFFNVTVWGKSADYVKEYIKKGERVSVVGKLKQETWTTQAGDKGSRVVIVANNVSKLDYQKKGDSQNNSVNSQGNSANNQNNSNNQNGYDDPWNDNDIQF